ncbi:uncharacterized protein LOC135104259 [Scylla paramamosain]|uniref:uncharacterized protein LOC135104259 n=1 Tax=Scylla paramamosain TaxID=85552 RepID=UPI0030839B1E
MDLLSDNSSSSSEHEAETSTKPRKRQRCPEKWIRAEIKHKCNRGEAYTSHTSKKEVGPRRVGPPCTCPDKCFTKMKFKLKGFHFHTMEDIQHKWHTVLDAHGEKEFQGANQGWQKCWKR